MTHDEIVIERFELQDKMNDNFNKMIKSLEKEVLTCRGIMKDQGALIEQQGLAIKVLEGAKEPVETFMEFKKEFEKEAPIGGGELKDENVEYRTQAHLMDVEGTSDYEPTIIEIKQHAFKRGFEVFEIDVFLDNMMRFWRFHGKIRKLKEDDSRNGLSEHRGGE